MKKQMLFKTKGMNRDLSVSAFNPEFAFENRNLRLGTNSANTMMSWVNEKGTASIPIVTGNWIAGNDSTLTTVTSITGTPIGTAVINHQLVVFTTDTTNVRDYIYVLKYADSSKTSMLCKMLFGSNNQDSTTKSLGFSVANPLETLVSYESEKIQKVYWTDGDKQPRVINIEGDIKTNNNTQFDFVPTLLLQETVKVKKVLGANGTFAPGVIQYALTYYTKYGQESNIFYTSPLLYISYRDRGASPEDKVENAFQIKISNIDTNFDYLRIYSIQRNSIDATPICKRIQDIAITGDVKTSRNASYIDTGTSGDSIDPTELLYKGGEVISAYTIEQKDNTLFLGNLEIKRPQIEQTIKDKIEVKREGGIQVSGMVVSQSTRTITATSVSTGSYVYYNQLNAYDSTDADKSVPCGGFKRGDVYRLGVQFQYESGRWSDPIYVDDVEVINKPSLPSNTTNVVLPTLTGVLPESARTDLLDKKYKRIRPVVVFPNIQDRNVICQGIVNPTMYTQNHQTDGDLYAQSSWFFRASYGRKVSSDGTCSPTNKTTLPYAHRGLSSGVPSGCSKYNPEDSIGSDQNPEAIRLVEIQGDFENSNKFAIGRDVVTFHSPDIEFDSQLALTDYSSSRFNQIGNAQFNNTMSDIDIQTETATISNGGSGFVHKSFKDTNTYGIISGLFYDDFVVDEDSDKNLEKYSNEYSTCKWMVYLWNKNGSLNNDINRPANKGVQSALLKKKIVSNLRFADTNYNGSIANSWNSYNGYTNFPQIFNSNEVAVLKLDTNIYMGNIDTVLLPDNPDGNYFCFNGQNGVINAKDVKTPFTSNTWYKTFSKDPETQQDAGLYKYNSSGWDQKDGYIGNAYLDLVLKKEAVRMKYKSTAHLVFSHNYSVDWFDDVSSKANSLPIIEITQNPAQRFGGTSSDAFRENIWLPCGEPVLLSSGTNINVKWEYGDTYYQRWDCLKTYAFTPEDINQVVEIGSFMLETHINIDGRYDKNRGQMNNLYMNPQNFNLINPVYSQKDNFFQYRIQNEDFYKDTVYPNQITWAKTKNSGADVDAWTNVTLASTLELDGDKGEITSLQKYNNQLLCFQDSSLCRISYNETYQITTTEGVPVEIANSGKVQGKNYISDTVGCSNKWSIVNGTMGLYFMDSDGKGIYLFNGQLASISDRAGFNSWCKLYIPSNSQKWTPAFPKQNDKSPFISYYDKINQEVLFINHDLCLAFSEKFGVFTSFYDYQNTPFFNNIDDTGVWLKGTALWKHQAGNYCTFFGTRKPYSMILVGNPDPQISKIFSNVEFRACVDGDGTENSSGIFTPYLPFDSLDTWNEYQHGMANLSNRTGHAAMQHHTTDNAASLKRKFRIWRCDIPRDNGEATDTFSETFPDSFHTISRIRKHPLDRMRNPWLYLRFRKDSDSNRRVEIHDVMMTYFD